MREPHLLPLTGETFTLRSVNTSQEARLELAVRGVNNSMEKTFWDIRVFHSGAASNQCHTVEASFKKHEDEKKRTYNARLIEVEKETFTSLVFSTTGRMGEEAKSLSEESRHSYHIRRITFTVTVSLTEES